MQLALETEKDYRQLLTDWYGNTYSKCLVELDRAIWFVKSKPSSPLAIKRDMLGYQLGQGWLNIAEVCFIEQSQFNELLEIGIKLSDTATPETSLLVRFAPDYQLTELPINETDKALAFELVYSIWIRRRDAHSFNRVYLGEIPVFYDFDTCFLGEPELQNLGLFFKQDPYPGWAGRWKLVSKQDSMFDTIKERERERRCFEIENGEKVVRIPTANRDRFLQHCWEAADRIGRISDDQIETCINLCGFTSEDATRIFDALQKNKENLPNAISVLIAQLIS